MSNLIRVIVNLTPELLEQIEFARTYQLHLGIRPVDLSRFVESALWDHRVIKRVAKLRKVERPKYPDHPAATSTVVDEPLANFTLDPQTKTGKPESLPVKSPSPAVSPGQSRKARRR